MSLPKIDKPTFAVTMPSSKKSVRFRMMTRREEKVLLVAKAAKPQADADALDPVILGAIRQVVESCAAEPIVVGSMPLFDLEYAFLRIRATSVNNRETQRYSDSADGQTYEIEVDLDKVEVVFPDDVPSTIDVGGGARIELRWPSVDCMIEAASAVEPEDVVDRVVAGCVAKVWVGDRVFDAQSATQAEVLEFVQTIDITAWDAIRGYMGMTPHLSYWIEWQNSKGDERRFELRSLSDFFTFR